MPGVFGSAGSMAVNPRRKEFWWEGDGPFAWRQLRVSYNSPGLVGVASLTGNVDFPGVPAGCVVQGAFIRVGANFTGPSIATATMSVGFVATPAAYVTAGNILSGAPSTITGLATVPPGSFLNPTAPTAAGTLRVQVLTTGANVSAFTTGWADVFVLMGFVELQFGE